MLDDELAEVTVLQIWAGVDIGKEHHHCVVLDAQGERLLSRRVLNDETALLELISDVLALSGETLWAVDINHGGAALLIGLLLSHDQPMVYITGLAVHQASTAYRGQGKTDEKDAFVIADQARMRKDLGLLRPGDEIAVDLRTLTARRTDLVHDRTRQINRLRAQLLEIFPEDMVADDEDLALDPALAGGTVGGQHVDVEVVVTGETDRFRMQRDRLTWSDMAADDGLGPVVDDRHRRPTEVHERPAVAVEERLQVLAGGETAERVPRVRQRHMEGIDLRNAHMGEDLSLPPPPSPPGPGRPGSPRTGGACPPAPSA